MGWGGTARIVLAALAAVIFATPCFGAGAVEVVVDNVRSDEGKVHAHICSEGEFLKSCRYGADAAAKAGSTIVVVPDVPPGRYAVVAYHDRNANGKADVNFLGFPTEDVGFSHDALKGLVKPEFSDAVFDHGAGTQRITLTLHRF
jgi:uncharacterized protein (DUF2141 family)